MKAIERLKRDHHILRAKLNILESALGMGPETWFVLREVCFTLARQLRDHIRREEELVAAYRTAMNPKVLAEISVEHREEPEHLRIINHLFVQERAQTFERIRPVLTQVIQGLRRHMAAEEAELFPILERELRSRKPVESMAASTERLDECMTVNRVMREHPDTRPVFERFFINVPLEGSSCLDEVAWRHGMDGRELLDQLEEVISASVPRASKPNRETITCDCR